MSAVTASLCSALMFVVFVSADQKILTAESGQNVTLTCRAPNNNKVVKWSRADLKTEYVFLYRDDHFVKDYQHPSFKSRVDLQDRQMKDGNMSLILRDVTINDTGTYECRVYIRETWKSILSTNLTIVPPPGPTGGHTEDGGKKDGGKEDRGKKDGGKEDRGKKDGGKEDRGKKDGPAGPKVGVEVSAAFLCAAVLLVAGVVRFWIKRQLQSKTYDDPEITQPLTSSHEDSYTDDLKIN